MKALTLMLLLLAAFTLQANASLPNLCQPLQKKVKVQYTINTSFSVGEKHQQQLTLWRTPQKVAHQYPTKLITQQWTRANNGRLSRTQYFDQDLRAIEFEIQSPQTSTDAHWQKKFQLVTNQLINSMNLVTTQGQACDLVKYYHLEKNGVIHQLTWMPHKSLVTRYRVSSAKMSKEWVLQTLDYDAEAVNRFFSLREQYPSTDFADIGDNESDPVLSKLIHLGFTH